MASTPRANTGAGLSGLLGSPSLPVILTVAAMIIGLAALLPLLQSSGATSVAGRIYGLERERTGWQARVRELELEIARMGSLDRVEQEAKTRLQMEAPKEVRYLTVDSPPPREAKLPSRFLPPEPPREGAGASLWEGIFGWLPLP